MREIDLRKIPDSAWRRGERVLKKCRYMRRYQQRRVKDKRAKGECLFCPSPVFMTSVLCHKHLLKRREYERRVRGKLPWQPGKRGTPPLELRPR